MAYANAHRLPLPSDVPSGASTSRSSTTLDVDAARLTPAFEAYKLAADAGPSSPSSRAYALPSRPPQLTELYQPPVGGDRREGSLTFTGLGYKETKERAVHQLLIPAAGQREQDDPIAGYIDANRFVVLLTYDSEIDKVTGHPVCRLEQSQGLPSLASIAPTTWLACDGENLVLIRLQKVTLRDRGAVRWSSASTESWKIPPIEEQAGTTIKAHTHVGGAIRVLLQTTKTVSKAGKTGANDGLQGLGFARSDEKPKTDTRDQGSKHARTVFEVRLVEINDSLERSDETSGIERTAKVLESVQGDEPLLSAQLDVDEWILGAEAPFAAVAASGSQPAVVSKPTFQPQTSTTPVPAAASQGRRPGPHFSWAQTGDTVTIAFALPAWMTSSHIRGHFSPSALSLSFTQEALTLLTASSSAQITEIGGSAAAEEAEVDDLTRAARMIASGRYVSRSTWGEIDATGSVWTLERAAGASLLTLHLEKKHEGTRWMQVFADRTRAPARNHGRLAQTQLSFQQARTQLERTAAGLNADEQGEDEEGEDAEDNEDDVPETMDPSELVTMLEGMQKYTVDEDTPGLGQDRSGLALDQPSLLKDSLEEEDANVGVDFVVTSVTLSSSGLTVRHSNLGEMKLLATRLESDREDDGLVAVKHELDGAIFARQAIKAWKHVATMPALAFVLASKRDAQRVHIHARRTSGSVGSDEYVALAFESAPRVTGSGAGSGSTVGSGAGNLFVYYTPASAGDKHAASRVVRLGAIVDQSSSEAEAADEGHDTASGALLGVCSVRLPAPAPQEEDGVEQDTLLCLCENRLLLLRGVL